MSKCVKRFLFVGSIEKKKLQSARQEKFETIADIEQKNKFQLKIILDRLLLTDLELAAGISVPWWPRKYPGPLPREGRVIH